MYFTWPCFVILVAMWLDTRHGKNLCKLSYHMATKNTWVGEHVNFAAIWSSALPDPKKQVYLNFRNYCRNGEIKTIK